MTPYIREKAAMITAAIVNSEQHGHTLRDACRLEWLATFSVGDVIIFLCEAVTLGWLRTEKRDKKNVYYPTQRGKDMVTIEFNQNNSNDK